MLFDRRGLMTAGAATLAFGGFARNVRAQSADRGAGSYHNEVEG